MAILEYSIPTRIEFGVDSLARLGRFAAGLGDRALVVCDHFLRQSGTIHTIEDILKSKKINAIVYDAVYPSADSRQVDEVALIARRSRSNLVVGVGGSRVCNLARIAAFLGRNEGDVHDYLHGRQGCGERVAYIQIPTLFREVYALTASAFTTDAADQANKVLTLEGLGTDVLLVDPVIMADLPAATALNTALDILSLSIEGYISLKIHPIVEPVLLRGVEIVYYNLAAYIDSPQNVTLREKLCTAGLFTALAGAVTGFGLSFALAMGMNGRNRVSKSLVSALLLPHMIEFNQSVAAGRFAKIARVMGKDTAGLGETDAAALAIQGVAELLDGFRDRLPSSFRELGIEKDDLTEAAEVAIRFEDVNSIPRKAAFENLMEILLKAY
ncbi:MAG: iron-containing alcohol dehydrogenase [Spirochaetota bacterium]